MMVKVYCNGKLLYKGDIVKIEWDEKIFRVITEESVIPFFRHYNLRYSIYFY